MILAKKVRLYPTKEQEQQLWKSVGTARFIYNWTLTKQKENYKNGGKFISDNELSKSITIVVKKLEKKIRRLQHTISQKYEMNKKGKEYVKTNNIIKLEKQIKLLHRRLANIRANYLHQTTSKIVKTKPARVVMETLNIKGMVKNRHLSKAIGEQCLYEFKRQMQYKCEFMV